MDDFQRIRNGRRVKRLGKIIKKDVRKESKMLGQPLVKQQNLRIKPLSVC